MKMKYFYNRLTGEIMLPGSMPLLAKDNPYSEELSIQSNANPINNSTASAKNRSGNKRIFGFKTGIVFIAALVLIVWIIFNAAGILIYNFDPIPFFLINVVLISVVVLKAQDIIEEKARIRRKRKGMKK